MSQYLTDKQEMATSPNLYFDEWQSFDSEDETRKLFMKQGWLVTVAARPKNGKSTFSAQYALNQASLGKNVLYVSLELSKEETLDKLVALEGGFNPIVSRDVFRDEDILQRKGEELTAAIERLSQYSLRIHDQSVSIWKLEEIMLAHKQIGLDIVVIDQLSFIQTGDKFNKSNKTSEYDYICRRLKMFARDHNILIVLQHQLNRQAENSESNVLSPAYLKDSSALEEMSDMLILFKKKDESNVVFSVTSRHQPGGMYNLRWNKKLAKFTD